MPKNTEIAYPDDVKRMNRRFDFPSGYEPWELEDLARKVVERNDGKHGDPLNSPYGWNMALLFARAYLAYVPNK